MKNIIGLGQRRTHSYPQPTTHRLRGLSKRQKTRVLECEKDAKDNYGLDPENEPIVIDIECSETFACGWDYDFTPCLTASRGSQKGFWVSSMSRRLNIPEMFKLQGMSPAKMEKWAQHMSEREIGFAIGNAMSVAVLERLVAQALWSAGLISAKILDPHHHKTFRPAFLRG